MFELEQLISVNDNTKIIQSDTRCCNMSAKSPTAKKFAWDIIEATKSTMESVGPIIGINNKEESVKFIEDLKHCLSSSDNYICFKTVAAQKIQP
ncbi:unnamed protein product [Rhizopus stolonifer]